METAGDVYVVARTGGYAGLGVAAQTNGVTALRVSAMWWVPFLHTKIYESEDFTMKELWNTIQLIFTAIGGWLGWFLGGFDGLLYALIIFVIVDYVTGVMCAVVDKKLSSEVGSKGICRKVLIFAMVGIAHVLDANVIGDGSVLRTAVIFFYISNEGVSLLENASHLGLPIPEKMKEILEQLHDRDNKESEGK